MKFVFSFFQVSKVLFYLSFIVALLVLLNVSSVEARDDKNKDKIILQLKWMHQFQFAGYYAALEQGYFLDEGLDVELRQGGPGINPIEEVLNGNAQYGVASGDLVYYRLNNRPVVVLASIFQHSASALATSKASNIVHPHDLVGKQVNLLDGGKPIIEIAAMLEYEGVSLDRIIQADNKASHDVPAKDEAKFVYLTNEPYFYELNKQPVNLIRPMNYGVDFYGDSLFTTENQLESNPEQVEKMRQAVIKGWQYALDHPEEIISSLLDRYGLKKTEDQLWFEAEVSRQLILPNIVEIGHLNEGRWQRMADTIVRLGMIPGSENFSGFVYHPKVPGNHDVLWSIVGFLAGGGSIVTLLTFVVLLINRQLKKHIAVKTNALQSANSQLREEVIYRELAEKQLIRHQEKLEEKVGLRTRELSVEVKEHQHSISLLKQSEAKLQGVLSSMNDTVYMFDHNKKIVFFHTPHQDQTLINMEQGVVGHGLGALVPVSVLSEFDKAIEKNKQGKIVEIDCFTDKTDKWFAVKLSPIFEDMHYRGSLAVSRDISERKNSEITLQSAKQEAEEANIVKGRFLATISHEIRTPLNAIIGINYLLCNTKLDESQKDYLDQMHASSTMLSNIIDDILDFSKAEAGTLKFDAVDLNVFQLIKRVGKTFEREINNKQIKLMVYIDQAIPTELSGYKLRLTQVMNNLLSNAIKFTAKNGHISIQVHLEDKTESEHLLRFSVSDDGIGIPSEEIDNLFRPFTQLNSKYSRQYGGSGLGLAISQNLVNVMGGNILCESEEGEGSRFSFTIPLTHQQLALLETEVDAENSKLDDLNVLIVDDDELNRLIVSELLREHVASITQACSGQEALQLCRENSFSIILMDVQMPDMDGYEAAYYIRKNREYAHLPIIAVTAHAAKEDHERSLEAGMNDHLTKPINPDQLLGMLKKWT